MALDGMYGIGRGWEVLSAFGKLCDRHTGDTLQRTVEIFAEAGYIVYCNGESGSENQKRRQSGVELAVK